VEEAADGMNNGVDLGVAMGWIEGQAQCLLDQTLGYRERAGGVAAFAIGRLKMDRPGIMDVAADA
jgi:hypothetical protein